jgi:hypothetical protein
VDLRFSAYWFEAQGLTSRAASMKVFLITIVRTIARSYTAETVPSEEKNDLVSDA